MDKKPPSNEDINLPVPGSETLKVTREQAINELWSMGVLSWKLHSAQVDIYEAFKRSPNQKFIINCSRRFGKSMFLCILAIEYAMQHPNSRICYAAPTAKAVKNIITPIINKILNDCPQWLRPEYKSHDQKYRFPNGSEIQIAGTDAERAEALRGGEIHLGICDEAGYMDRLDYVVGDIMMPMCLHTGGKIIIASTPPASPAHDFVTYVMQARITGNYIEKNIFDNPLLSPLQIARAMMEVDPKLTEEEALQLVAEKKSPESSTWQREYMAQIITDQELAVIPEFSQAIARGLLGELVAEVPRPHFFDTYVGMDIGFNDFTAVLFGYWDFINARLVIEDELVLSRMITQQLADGIREKETALWGDKRVYQRYSDTDLIVISDLQRTHDILFQPVKKDNKEAAINQLREWIKDRKIIIHPRCKHTIAHLECAIWNKMRTKFERSGEYGHFDCVDALIYLSRSISRHKNPIPSGHGMNENTMYVPNNAYKSKSNEQVKKMFDVTRFFPKNKR